MLADRFAIGIRRIFPQASSEGGQGSQASKRKGGQTQQCRFVDCCSNASGHSKKRLQTNGGRNEPKCLYPRRKMRLLQSKRRKNGSGKRRWTTKWTKKTHTRARRKRRRRWRTLNLCFFTLSNVFVLLSHFIFDSRPIAFRSGLEGEVSGSAIEAIGFRS